MRKGYRIKNKKNSQETKGKKREGYEKE